MTWPEEVHALHEEASRTHFLDVWTREAILARLGPQPEHATIVDLGCSTGYLLEELRHAYPAARLIGIDLFAAGLVKAKELVPDAELIQADARDLPLDSGAVRVLVSANMLEHVDDDRRAIAEIHRVLVPGARAVLVVPAGPSTYDYYDRFLGHERRYAHGELAEKARSGARRARDRRGSWMRCAPRMCKRARGCFATPREFPVRGRAVRH